MEVPAVPFIGTIVDVPVIMPYMQRQAPQIQTVAKTVEVPPVPFMPVVMQIQRLAQTQHIDMSRSASRSSHRPPM